MARPKKSKPRSKRISFRLTEEEYEILNIIADYAGLSLSDLIRSWLLLLILRFKMGLPLTLPEVNLYVENNLSLPYSAKS